jgi:hypothetical protein
MKRALASLIVALLMSAPLVAGELDQEIKSPAKPEALAVKAPSTPVSELDAESPTQAWGRYRWGAWGCGYRGWGWGGYGGWGVGFYRPWGGWCGGWGGCYPRWGWGVNVGFYRPWGGFYHGGCW